MAITRVKTSSILQNFPKERSMLAGNDGDTGAYESIATVSVGAGGQAAVEFTNIPSTFQHLQLRFISQDTASGQYFLIQFNGDTSNTKYTWHSLEGNGSNAVAFANSTGTHSGAVFNYAAGSTGSIFSAGIVDILDYKDTNKYKTVRSLGGYDSNGGGYIQLQSNLFLSTSAISSINIIYNSGNHAQYTHVALYGIR